TDASVAGSYDDTITGGGVNDVASDVIFGGNGSDSTTTAAGNDIIVGDNGSATFSAATGLLTDVASIDTTIGGVDTINAGNGANLVIGGPGADKLTTGSGADVIFGDNGHAI